MGCSLGWVTAGAAVAQLVPAVPGASDVAASMSCVGASWPVPPVGNTGRSGRPARSGMVPRPVCCVTPADCSSVVQDGAVAGGRVVVVPPWVTDVVAESPVALDVVGSIDAFVMVDDVVADVAEA